MLFFHNIKTSCLSIGSSPADDEELKLKKSSLLIVPFIIGPAAFIWGLLYIYLDHYMSAAIPLSYTVISILNVWHLHKTKNIVPLYKTQMTLVLLLPFFLMWSLGGYALGSFVFIWGFFAPIAALTYEESKQALNWFYYFIVLVVISTLIDQYLLESHTTFMPQMAVELFFLLNISAGLSGIYFLIRFFINEKDKNALELLQKEHEELLHRTEELKKANNELDYFAYHDALTKLPNRYYLRENLAKILSHAKRHEETIALLFIDLDGFKSINDTFGHATGDEVLKDVAFRIKSLLREEDTVARIGGDEFALIIGDITNLTYIEKISERIISEINRDYESVPTPSPVGVSIGISLFPKDAQDIDTLINYADEAMYRIKKSSKNDYLFYTKEENDVQ